MTKRRLPVGMQTFRNLRERNCYYVDKMLTASRCGGTIRIIEGIVP